MEKTDSLEIWLKSLGDKFGTLSDDAKNKTLDYIISISPASQLYHLSEILEQLLKRDFIVQLPREIAFYLLQFLDPETLLICCEVSKDWQLIVGSCLEAWRRACLSLGMSKAVLDSGDKSVKFYRELYSSMSERIGSLKSGNAVETSLLFGHTDRVMAVHYSNGVLATGSDDRTVRLWDCETSTCIKVLLTHTVADIKLTDTEVITASFDTTAAVWDINSGTMIRQYTGHVAAVFSVDFDRELDILVTGSADSTVKVWSFSQGSMLKNLPQHRSAWIIQVKLYWDKSREHYYILSRDNVSIHVWQLGLDHSIITMDEWQHPHNDLVTGLQVLGPKVTFATVDTCNTCYIAQKFLNDHESMAQKECYKLPGDSFIQAFLGGGEQFDAILLLDGEQPTVDIIKHDTQQVLTSITLPTDYRPSKRGSTFTLGERNWLDGFDGSNDSGVFFVTSLRDNTIYVLRWKDLVRKNKLV